MRYTFIDKDTDEEYEVDMTYDEITNLLATYKNLQQTFVPIRINWRGKVHVDQSFKDILKKIKKDYPRSTINENPG